MSSVADLDPGSGAFLTPGSGMNHPDNFSESLETIFFGWKYLIFYVDPGSGLDIIWIRDPGWKKFESGIREKNPRSATMSTVIKYHRIFFYFSVQNLIFYFLTAIYIGISRYGYFLKFRLWLNVAFSSCKSSCELYQMDLDGKAKFLKVGSFSVALLRWIFHR